MSLSLGDVYLQVVLATMMAAVSTMTVTVSTTTPHPTTSATTSSVTIQQPPDNCPVKCNCASMLTCSDLGEQSRMINFTDVVTRNYSSLRFDGRTKVRTIQTRAFTGLNVQRLQLDRLGVRSIQAGAFLGVHGLRDVDIRHNHIDGLVDGRTFSVDTALNSLNVSDNDIESLSSDAFASVGGSSLKDLLLANNRLMVLPDKAFANLTGLQHLDLSGNRLVNLTRPLFDDLLSLKRMFLANNEISHLDPTLFNSLSLLEHLALDNNKLSTLPALSFSRLTTLRTLTLNGNRLRAIHADVFPTRNVKIMQLSTLKLDRNRISNLTQVELSGLTSLRTLTLAGNQLTAIPPRYFARLYRITVLNLSRNNISSVLTASSFEGLRLLSSLNLSSNNIKRISARTFGPSLRTLDLSNNDYLTYLQVGVFENARYLAELHLRSNGLYSVFPSVFSRMISLEYLDLSNNVITNVHSDSFCDLPSLRRVVLSKNNIYSLPNNIFVNTSQLSHVSLDENRLSKIPVDTMSLPNLRNFTLAHNSIGKLQALQSDTVNVLNLTGNFISDIVDGAFNGTPQISELYLSQNQLTTITDAMFSGLNFLGRLDLSDNRISRIEVGSFQFTPYLTYLNLHGNQLTSVESGMVFGLYSINSLVLSANRLVNVTGLRELPSLKDVVLDDNDIISFDVRQVVNFESGLQRLSLRRNKISRLQFDRDYLFSFSFLDLGDNQLTEVIFHSLQNMPLLKKLKLDANNITSVPTVKGLNASLTELDLSHNSLTDSSLANIVQLRQLQQLRLDGNRITELSTADLSLLANSLSVLSLSNNRLTSLDQVGKLSSLTQLFVDNNLIESISDDTFQLLYDLDVVSLRGNRLTMVGRQTLRGLEQKCTRLDLSSNSIGFIHPMAFHHLSNIRLLNLSNNSVSEVVFPPIMDQLTELWLSNNRLVRFPDGLRVLRSINVLKLCNNTIESLPALDIGNEFGVMLVDLSYNRLHDINEVRIIGSINVINIGKNRLRDIAADVLADATFITELILSNNALGKLPVAVTLAVGRIAHLRADKCFLTSLDNWVVPRSPTRLIHLSLSSNRLAILPPTVIRSVSSSLERLDVRGNLLSTLNRNSHFGRSSSCRFSDHSCRLLLAGNPWNCDCQLAWLRSLGVTVDYATCWSPSSTTGQHVLCYDVDNCPVRSAYKKDIRRRNIDLCEIAAPPGPVVSSVWPLFGPQAGGTLLTVNGTDLVDSQQPTIILISSNSNNIVTLSTDAAIQSGASNRSAESEIVRKTPASNTTGERWLVVVQHVDKALINTTQYFVYRQNTHIIDIFPLTHLLSGGTTVTVRGDNVDAAAQPGISVTVVVTRFNSTDHVDQLTTSQTAVTSQRCVVINSTLMTCTMPEVRLPSDFQVNNTATHFEPVQGPNDRNVSMTGEPVRRDRAAIYVGLLFDGYNYYRNLTAVMPDITFKFFQPPTFDASVNLISYRPNSFSDIDIMGKNLQRGVRISDYRVVIGNGECKLSSLSDNQLTCRPPYSEPQLSRYDVFCNNFSSILVHVAHSGPFLYSCIQYDMEEIDVATIVAIVAILGIPFILLIILAVMSGSKREKESFVVDENQNNIELSPVVTGRPDPAAEPRNPVFSRSTDNERQQQTAVDGAETRDDSRLVTYPTPTSTSNPPHSVQDIRHQPTDDRNLYADVLATLDKEFWESLDPECELPGDVDTEPYQLQ